MRMQDSMTKNELRNLYKNKRKALSFSEVREKSEKIQNAFLESNFYKNARQIMLYMPLGNEVLTTQIIARTNSDGKRLVFPKTDAKTYEINPVLWDGKSGFLKETFSVQVPENAKVADMKNTDIVVVPGVAFSKDGRRIGFGKGCYDRLLFEYSGVKVGFCYDFQITSEIPADCHDIKMDFLVSESGWIDCKKEN